MRYVILERTPVPSEWQPLADAFLQDAELQLALNRRHYHERALKVGGLLLYTFEDALRIVGYRSVVQPLAELQLFAYWGVD